MIDADLRPAVPSDAEGIADILAVALPDPWSAAMVADALRHGCRGLVAEREGVLEGVALVMVVVPEAELLQVAVLPARRRHGLGRRLVRGAMALAARAGASEMLLEVRPSNEAARALYLSEGFAPAGLRRGYYRNGEDALMLRRGLSWPLPGASGPRGGPERPS